MARKPYKESVQLLTGEARLSYAHIFEKAADPSGRMVYSCSVLIPKTDQQAVKELFESVQKMLTLAVNGGYFKQEEVPALHNPIYDGDEHVKIGKRGEEYAGFYYINCKSSRPIPISKLIEVPGGTDVVKVIDPDEVYSGCWARVAVSIFAFDNLTRGIGTGLNGVMKTRDDDRFDGVPSSDSLFSQFKTAQDSAGAGGADMGGFAMPGTQAPAAEAPAQQTQQTQQTQQAQPADTGAKPAATNGAPGNPFADLT